MSEEVVEKMSEEEEREKEEEEESAVIGGVEYDIKELRSMTREAEILSEFAKLEVDSGDYEWQRKRLKSYSRF